MTIRPKTKRRLLILLIGVALFSVSAAWLYSYRIAVAERKLLQDKQVGLDAYRAGDYQTAIDKLTEYINHEQERNPQGMDPQALLAFANARAKIPTKNEDYIVTAVTTLRRYCAGSRRCPCPGTSDRDGSALFFVCPRRVNPSRRPPSK